MLKRLFFVALGAVGALQADKWFNERRARFTPHALTGSLLDKLNDKLERDRVGQAHDSRL